MAISWKIGDKFRTKTVRDLTSEGWTIVSGKAIPPSHIWITPLDVLNTSEEVEIIDTTQSYAGAVEIYNVVRTRDNAIVAHSFMKSEVQDFLDYVVDQTAGTINISNGTTTYGNPLTASHSMWGGWPVPPTADSHASQWETAKPAPEAPRACTCEFYSLLRDGCKCGGV